MNVNMTQSTARSIRILAIALCASLGACSWIPKGESGLDVGIKDRGIASWYGGQFHGRLAANGEIFDMSALTAAHRTLPLGTMVRVVNLHNGRHVRVRIIDRGPYVNGRILDLSYAAAARLGMVDGGLSVIQLEVIGDHRLEVLVTAEESRSGRPFFLTVQKAEAQMAPTSSYPALDRPGSTMSPVHRQPPNDVLLQRRWRWAPSVLADDPFNRDVPTLLV